MEQMRKKYEYKQNLIGNEYQILPLDDRKVRLNVIGEIAQAEDFNDADNIYIKYDFMLPPWFQLDYEEIIEVHQEDDKRMEDMMEDWNKTASVTQATMTTLERGENGNKKLVANFCFPFDLQMLVDEDYLNFNKSYPKHKDNQQTQQKEDGIRFPKFPILFMQVNSSDSFGRTKIEGYGFCHIPREPGFHEIKVQTWAPYVSLQQQIHSFFLGGSMKVKDIKKIAETSFITDENVETRLNRYNVNTESKGSIKVNFNIAFQSKTFKDKQDIKKKKEKLEKNYQQYDKYRNLSNGQKLNQQSTIDAGGVHTTRFQNTKLQEDRD